MNKTDKSRLQFNPFQCVGALTSTNLFLLAVKKTTAANEYTVAASVARKLLQAVPVLYVTKNVLSGGRLLIVQSNRVIFQFHLSRDDQNVVLF